MRILFLSVLVFLVMVEASAATTIPVAKQQADDASFAGNALVTATFPGFFYIQADSRECGIRVNKADHALTPGVRVGVVGTLRTNSDGERYIDAISAGVNGSGTPVPCGMNNKAVGGDDWFYIDGSTAGQKGVLGGTGLNNVGLLIRTSGFVTYSGPDFFYIDDGSALHDGSSFRGIRVVPHGSSSPMMESYVQVTGISSCYGTGARPGRQILASDAVTIIKEADSTTWFTDLNGVNNADTLATWTDKLHSLSVGWIRMGHDMEWQAVEPQQDQWSFAGVDQKVLALQNAGFKILPILCYTADWAAGPYGTLGAAANLADWEDYVRTIVSRYIAPPYNVKYWQVWNEPTIDAWFRGASNQEFIDKMYLPAARIIREYGGYVVFGGWPSNNTIATYESILNYNNAWQYTDYADIHYFNAKWMETLYNNWVATGKLRGVWQTEVGWKTRPGYLASLYPRVLRFQLSKNSKSPDLIKLFWYASWSTGADVGKSFLEGDWSNPVLSNPNGTRLKVLADLFSAAPAHVRADVTLTASASITFQMDEAKSSFEAFTVGARTIVAAHVKSTSGVTQFTLSWPSKTAPTRIRRISSAGDEQDLAFTWNSGSVSVTVPLSGIPTEDAYSNVFFQNLYVVADG